MKRRDIGCGSGAFTELLAQRCAPAEIQGIDPSEAQFAFARARPALREATFLRGDAMALPFETANRGTAKCAADIGHLSRDRGFEAVVEGRNILNVDLAQRHSHPPSKKVGGSYPIPQGRLAWVNPPRGPVLVAYLKIFASRCTSPPWRDNHSAHAEIGCEWYRFPPDRQFNCPAPNDAFGA